MSPLIAAAIHDAKNGLAVLNTWLEEARRRAPSPELDEARAVAVRVGTQLVELLALYRAGENSLRLAVEDHDLGDFCREVCGEIIVPAGCPARIDCDFAAAEQIGPWAFDAYQVKLALQDALRNGLRHGRSRVVLAVQVVAVEAGGGLRFTVRDDGPGFPESVLAGGQAPMAGGSSGLGLAFARLIAERHATPNGRRGHVELANDEAGGAVFSLILP